MAVIDDDDRQSVFVVENGQAQRRQVEVGYSRGEFVEIVSGLTDGERVITIGQTGLAEGAMVEVVGTGVDDDGEVGLAAPALEASGGSDG
jgi:multidrug efflux pump subunit AcrA (membrane-fusion protein)